MTEPPRPLRARPHAPWGRAGRGALRAGLLLAAGLFLLLCWSRGEPALLALRHGSLSVRLHPQAPAVVTVDASNSRGKLACFRSEAPGERPGVAASGATGAEGLRWRLAFARLLRDACALPPPERPTVVALDVAFRTWPDRECGAPEAIERPDGAPPSFHAASCALLGAVRSCADSGVPVVAGWWPSWSPAGGTAPLVGPGLATAAHPVAQRFWSLRTLGQRVGQTRWDASYVPLFQAPAAVPGAAPRESGEPEQLAALSLATVERHRRPTGGLLPPAPGLLSGEQVEELRYEWGLGPPRDQVWLRYPRHAVLQKPSSELLRCETGAPAAAPEGWQGLAGRRPLFVGFGIVGSALGGAPPDCGLAAGAPADHVGFPVLPRGQAVCEHDGRDLVPGVFLHAYAANQLLVKGSTYGLRGAWGVGLVFLLFALFAVVQSMLQRAGQFALVRLRQRRRPKLAALAVWPGSALLPLAAAGVITAVTWSLPVIIPLATLLGAAAVLAAGRTVSGLLRHRRARTFAREAAAITLLAADFPVAFRTGPPVRLPAAGAPALRVWLSMPASTLAEFEAFIHLLHATLVEGDKVAFVRQLPRGFFAQLGWLEEGAPTEGHVDKTNELTEASVIQRVRRLRNDAAHPELSPWGRELASRARGGRRAASRALQDDLLREAAEYIVALRRWCEREVERSAASSSTHRPQ